MTLTAPFRRPPRRRPGPRPVTTPTSLAFSQALPWLLGSLTMIMGTLIGQVPSWTLLVFAGCAYWRLRTEHRHGSLPSMPVRTLVFLPIAFLLVRTYGTRPTAAGMLAFLIALISLKILELRSSRDFTVVALLTYFMVLSAFFFNQSLALSLYLVVAIAANSVALIRCHSGGRREVWPAVGLALGLAAQSLPLVVLLFVVFPRVHGDFLRRFNGGGQGETGMSDHLTPGSFSTLAQSNDLAFRARIGVGQTVPAGQLYWRGLVLPVCERAMSWRAADPGRPLPASDKPPTGSIEQQITLIPQGEPWLFALDRPVEVKGSANVRAQLFQNNVLRSPTPLLNKAIYTVYSESTSAVAQPLDDIERRRYLRLPTDLSPRVLALAQGWKQQSHSEVEIVQAANHFFETGNFSYTLTPGRLPTHDAIDYFLFTSRQGFCEHYAAAFSTLMRAAGVPSRVVVGYQGGEYNRWGGHYIIRQSDSHAWSEVFIAGHGWQREDPTAMVAPERVSYGAESYSAFLGEGALSDEMRLDRLNALNAPGSLHWLFHNGLQVWDTIDEQWNTMVLGYDQDTQLTVMEKLGVSRLDWLGGTALTLAVAFFLLGLGVMVMRPIGWNRSAPVDPARRLYERFCARLAHAIGVQRTAAEGPLDFSRRATVAAPVYADDIERITRLYVASRYAAPGEPDQTTAALRSAVKGFSTGRGPDERLKRRRARRMKSVGRRAEFRLRLP